MQLNVGNVGGFMRQADRTARAYVYDVAQIVAVLEYQALPTEVHHGHMPFQSLVDGFFMWALDSFQFLGIEEYKEYDFTTNVLGWFNQQERARSMLWDIFSVEAQYAGRECIVVRRRNTLWLFVLT
jgi:hypothetical protein